MSLSLPARQRCGAPKSLPLPRAGGDGSKLRSKRKATSKLWLLKARSLVSPWQLAQVGCATLLYEKDQRSLYVTQNGKGEENMQCPIKPSGMSCQMSTCGQSGQLEAFEHVGSSRFIHCCWVDDWIGTMSDLYRRYLCICCVDFPTARPGYIQALGTT